jgi:hypothetical protein
MVVSRIVIDVDVKSEGETENVLADMRLFIEEQLDDYLYDNYDYDTDEDGPEIEITWNVYADMTGGE